jgi:hypothetical protein
MCSFAGKETNEMAKNQTNKKNPHQLKREMVGLHVWERGPSISVMK